MRALVVSAALLSLACGSREAARAPVVELSVDVGDEGRPIASAIYGINGARAAGPHHRLVRFGGTRTSTYNFENNASNAGHDPPAHQNDGWLSESTARGAAVLEVIEAAAERGGVALITLPMIGHAAADRAADGDVGQGPDVLARRFVPIAARCDGSEPPRAICQDALVALARDAAAARGVPLVFALGNEPGGWPVTNPRLRADRPTTYAQLIDSSRAHAAMIREVAPEARIIGPGTFGWPAMVDLAGAPDARGRGFLETYRDALVAAGALDALDLHWYPAVQVDGVALGSSSRAPAVVAARVQAPRSLYDEAYVEPSWIAADDLGGEAIALLPRLQRAHPGVGLVFSEWAYGGGDHPSGAVAAADALGAFGRHGAEAAAYWPLTDQGHEYVDAVFALYARFGDASLPATSADNARVGVWASRGSEGVRVVVIHRSAGRGFAHLGGFPPGTRARRFIVDGDGPHLRAKGIVTLEAPLPLTPLSVTLLEILEQ